MWGEKDRLETWVQFPSPAGGRNKQKDTNQF